MVLKKTSNYKKKSQNLQKKKQTLQFYIDAERKERDVRKQIMTLPSIKTNIFISALYICDVVFTWADPV